MKKSSCDWNSLLINASLKGKANSSVEIYLNELTFPLFLVYFLEAHANISMVHVEFQKDSRMSESKNGSARAAPKPDLRRVYIGFVFHAVFQRFSFF